MAGMENREHPRIASPRYGQLPVGATFPGNTQRGIALVITLILLSVITFMTVTFLVVSRHEGEQVDTTTQQNVSKFAADGIEKMAEAQIAAQMMGTGNGFNFGLVVSTNFYQYLGYDPGTPQRTNLLNVSYNYINANGGGPLNQADLYQMLNNLQFLPRAPVFISTNRNQPNPEFRFYLDENGNGMYDPNYPILETGLNGSTVVNQYVGDPEWIGFLDHPEQRHSASNMFLSRGAFIAQPIGNSLDINYIHSQSKFLVNGGLSGSPYEGFFRNEGMGSWEINLAAFLQTLNTNVWGAQVGSGYTYSTNRSLGSQGAAFYDAGAIMQYRYGGSYFNLNSFQSLYSVYNPLAATYFDGDYLDGYSAGILLTTSSLPAIDLDLQFSPHSWSGADNPLQFVRPRDLYNLVPPNPTNALPPAINSFTNHLYQAGVMYNPNPPANPPPSVTNSYNRTTLYRLLSQMGIGSAPEPEPYPIGGTVTSVSAAKTIPSTGIPVLSPYQGRSQMSFGTVPEPYPYVHAPKMSLNYDNIHYPATNFVPWTPAAFFTNAADRMLRTTFPTNIALLVNGRPIVTNVNISFIPIYPVNYYTPAVHRILQLAANMYDASTNKAYNFVNQSFNQPPNNFDYPSVFRPYFGILGSGANTIVYINGYTEQLQPGPPNSIPNDPFWSVPLDLRRPGDFTTLVNNARGGVNTINNIYAVPYVLGARPNLPNFNEFAVSSVVNLYRTLQMYRTTPGGPIFTNVSYAMGISNVVGVQCWNSYTNYIVRPGGIRINGSIDFSVENSNTFVGRSVRTNGYVFGLQPSYTVPISTTLNPWTNGVNGVNGNYKIPTSFAVPIMGSYISITNGSYAVGNGNYTLTPTFLPLSRNYTVNHSYLPDWGINITNRVRLVMQDVATLRILDCVQLGGLGQVAGLDAQDSVLSNLLDSPMSNFWDPTPVSPSNLMARGINNQIATAANLALAEQAYPYWINAAGVPFKTIQTVVSGLDNFLVSNNLTGPVQVGFAVPGVFAKTYVWSANDPLVHYTVGDLTDQTKSGAYALLNQPNTQINSNTVILSNLFTFSPRYLPWNTYSAKTPLNNIGPGNQLAYRDPLPGVGAGNPGNASVWQFPGNKYPNVGWLGRVHRGTPWQTVYLKAPGVDITTVPVSTWQAWTGNPNYFDAAATQPVNDWQLMDLFTTAPNDNASRGQLSVNQTGAAAWAAVLDGVIALSNSPTGLVPVVIDTTNFSATGQPLTGQAIINAIIQTNLTLLASQGRGYMNVGQILSVPQLTTASPYLTGTGPVSDAAYEWIPQQIMSLLRVGTPRYAIYAYGQALKPANNSIVQQSGPYFGMCTNYQITGEVMTRTIVRFDNPPVPGFPPPASVYTNAIPLQNALTPEYVNVVYTMPPMKAVVESYEILGPDQ